MLANPNTTVALASSSVLFLPVGANKKSSPQDKNRDEDLNVADDIICGVSSVKTSGLGQQ